MVSERDPSPLVRFGPSVAHVVPLAWSWDRLSETHPPGSAGIALFYQAQLSLTDRLSLPHPNPQPLPPNPEPYSTPTPPKP